MTPPAPTRPADDRAPSPARARILLATFAHVPVLLLLGTMAAAVLTVPGDTVAVGRGDAAVTLVPARHAQLAIVAVLAPLTGIVIARIVRGVLLLATLRTAARAAGLAPGEAVRWCGRPGWRSFDALRLLPALLAALGPALYAAWLWRIWRESDALVGKLFWTFGATFLLGGTVVAAIAGGSGLTRAWLGDLFGTLVVTDRRIAWCAPFGGAVYRALEGDTLLGAGIVERRGRRGWIALSVRRGGDVAEIDLRGVPAPDRALAAIEQLIAAR